MQVLGIDVGGSGIKAAPVDTKDGRLLEDRHRIETPKPATPKAVAKAINELVKDFAWTGPLGIGLPGVVHRGVLKTAANIDDGWLNTNAANLIRKHTGLPSYVINDADAAGIAELQFGSGNPQGSVILVTIGTGLGTCLFRDGVLFPNSELGHIELNGGDAELFAADSARKREELSWEQWSQRFDLYLNKLEQLLWPDLFIFGGGCSKKLDKFEKQLTISTPFQAAKLKNEAGIIGAALHGARSHN